MGPEITPSTHDLSVETPRQSRDATGQKTPANDAQRAGDHFATTPHEHPPPHRGAHRREMSVEEKPIGLRVPRVRVGDRVLHSE